MDNDSWERISALLSSRENGPGKLVVKRQIPGGNNRVYQVTYGSKDFLVKEYFRDSSDPRDRGGTEHRFTSFLWSNQVRITPRPISYDNDLGIGVYEYIEGVKASSPVTRENVSSLLGAFAQINSLRELQSAKSLPSASEACFSFEEHVAAIDRRVAKAAKIEGSSELAREAKVLMSQAIEPDWYRRREIFFEECKQLSISPTQLFSDEFRYLSPSDFGFHNALFKEGTLRVIDLEYAGWDDLGKVGCDLLLQPEIPIQPEDYLLVLKNLSQMCPGFEEEMIKKFQLLLPLYQIKWCCILLNEFLPLGQSRRQFAMVEEKELRKSRQLEKTKALLKQDFYDLTFC